MVPLMITKTLNQVTPHQHPLVREEVSIANSTDDDEMFFICSGCDTYGTTTGVKYQCKQKYCNFNLHEDCATCPMTLSTHIHPKHQLKLVWRLKDDLPCCDVCGYQVKGLYYSCPDASCNNLDNTFVLHPTCSKLPSQWSHVTDRKHNLTFQSAAPSWCTICRDPCTSWRYRCGPCGIDIHIECVMFSAPCHDPPNSGVPTPQQQQQQLYQPPPFPPLDDKDNINYSYYPQQHQYNNQQPPPPMQQQQHHYHHHQQKRPLPNHFGYPLQQPPLLPLQQPPPMQQQQQHQYYHHHQEKHPLPPLIPNHFGYPLQQPPLHSAHCYVYNPSSAFGMVSPPPVHHQYYYGQQQQQYQQPSSTFVAHPYNMYYQQQPAYYHPGGGGGEVGGSGGVTNISSSSTSSSGGVTNISSSSTSSGGGRKRRMALAVAKFSASMALLSVFGPVISPFC